MHSRPAFTGTPRETLTSLSRDIGPCVYFLRLPDGTVKIGHTGNVARRKKEFRVDWSAVLAIVPGTIADEAAELERFSASLAHGREYFHPTPDLMAHINAIRQRLNVPAV